jgi:hypothetical protein
MYTPGFSEVEDPDATPPSSILAGDSSLKIGNKLLITPHY